jgi:glycosyltransferase involved in cell wall biosynthesis
MSERPIDVIIPAFNEEASIAAVLADIPRPLVRRIVVVDNASTDRTAEAAAAAGAVVIHEPARGYGSACLAGLRHIAADPPSIVTFLDADYSDRPEELPSVVQPLLDGTADLVVGSRVTGEREPGALLPQARFGNWLATRLIHLLYGERMTDLGPFRAISWPRLVELRMADRDFGWTVEMQVKAARAGLRYREVPVSYRKRIGTSKITGTVSGSVRAGWKILYTIFRLRGATSGRGSS